VEAFKRRPVLRTCTLSDVNVRDMLTLFRRGRADMEFMRYTNAKEALKERGASIGLVDRPEATRVEVRLELPTANPTIDDKLYGTVVGMGFDLKLVSSPDGKDRRYVVTERGNRDISRIADMAEDLLRLAELLKTPEYQAILAKPPPPPYVPPEQQRPERRDNVVVFRKAS
jgi:hypothetical protein